MDFREDEEKSLVFVPIDNVARMPISKELSSLKDSNTPEQCEVLLVDKEFVPTTRCKEREKGERGRQNIEIIDTNSPTVRRSKISAIHNKNVPKQRNIVSTNNIDKTGCVEEDQSKPKQYDSVWDIDFREDEEKFATIVPVDDTRMPILKEFVFLEDSDTPDDWDALSAEEERLPRAKNTEEGGGGGGYQNMEAIGTICPTLRPKTTTNSNKHVPKQRVAVPTNIINATNCSKQVQAQSKPKQYDSIWDMNFEEDKEKLANIVPIDDARRLVLKEFVSLEDSDTPEDWETLLVADEEILSRTRSRKEEEKEEGRILPQDDVIITQEDGDKSIIEMPCKEKYVSTAPKHLSEQHICDNKTNNQSCRKSEIVRYNSVWDMHIKENDEKRFDCYNDQKTSSVLMTTCVTLQCCEPQVEWEDFY